MSLLFWYLLISTMLLIAIFAWGYTPNKIQPNGFLIKRLAARFIWIWIGLYLWSTVSLFKLEDFAFFPLVMLVSFLVSILLKQWYISTVVPWVRELRNEERAQMKKAIKEMEKIAEENLAWKSSVEMISKLVERLPELERRGNDLRELVAKIHDFNKLIGASKSVADDAVFEETLRKLQKRADRSFELAATICSKVGMLHAAMHSSNQEVEVSGFDDEVCGLAAGVDRELEAVGATQKQMLQNL